jgi:hypothetical protein
MFSVLATAPWLTAARVRRLAVVFAVFAVLLWAADGIRHAGPGLVSADGDQLGRDFINYWAGAHLAADGHAAQVYDLDRFAAFERSQTAPNAHLKWYAYPPVTLLLTLPLAPTGFVAGLLLWLGAGGLLVAALLKRDLGWRWSLVAAFTAPAALMNAVSGQNGAYSAALLAGGILALERRPWLAGLLFGALCFKPHLALLLPVALIAGGYWRTLLAAALSALALTGASFAAFGADTWSGFLHNAPINVHVLEHGLGFWERMPTPFAAVRLAGGSNALAYAVQGASALAAAVITARVWRSAAPMRVRGAVLVLAGFAATPYAWDYDLVASLFAAAWLAAEARRTGFAPYEKFALFLLVALPLVTLMIQRLLPLNIGCLILWGGLAVAARRAAKSSTLPLGTAIAPC